MTTMIKPTLQVAERELVIERIFDAPVDLVWQAWTDPEHIKRWWGPKDFTAPVIKKRFPRRRHLSLPDALPRWSGLLER